MKLPKEVFIDTNVFVIGALDLYKNRQSEQVDIIMLVKNSALKMVVNLKLLEEFFRLGERLLGKDFGGWVRFLLFTDLKPRIVLKDEYEHLLARHRSELPKEDLEHYACIKSQDICLISENREFIRKSRGIESYTCSEFLDKLKRRKTRGNSVKKHDS